MQSLLIYKKYVKRLCHELAMAITSFWFFCFLWMFCMLQIILWQQTFSQWILEQKNEIVDSIYANPAFVSLLDAQPSKMTLEDLWKFFDDLSLQSKNLKLETSHLEQYYTKTQSSIQQVIQEATTLHQKLLLSLDEIEKNKKNLAIMQQNFETVKHDLEMNKDYLSRYTILLYTLQNEIYSDNAVSEIKLFAKSDDIASTLSEDEFVKILTDKMDFLLYTIAQTKSSYENQISSINNLQLQLDEDVRSYNIWIEDLQEQKAELSKLMNILQLEQNQVKDGLQQIEDSKIALQEQMQVIKGNVRNVSYMNQSVWKILSKDDKELWDKYFTWPVLPIKKILAYYKDTSWKEKSWNDHDGLRVSVNKGQEVFSPAPAIVYKIQQNWTKNSSYSVVLVHRYGYISILLPLSKILVKEWEYIERGQIIWLTSGKWTILSGEGDEPYLYRELLHEQGNADPLLMTDISIFPSSSFLSSWYHQKYEHDISTRTIILKSSRQFAWNTPAQRISSFLSKYVPEPYNDISLRLQASKGKWIDPYFGVCIGRAETSYKHFKSTNNIGNVWNDDSGNTQEFQTPQEWIAAIFQVLNNSYLWKYYTMNQLSRYGNDDGYIYASSSLNRQTNIMSCLSAIYWYSVPEDYPFRRMK